MKKGTLGAIVAALGVHGDGLTRWSRGYAKTTNPFSSLERSPGQVRTHISDEHERGSSIMHWSKNANLFAENAGPERPLTKRQRGVGAVMTRFDAFSRFEYFALCVR